LLPQANIYDKLNLLLKMHNQTNKQNKVDNLDHDLQYKKVQVVMMYLNIQNLQLYKQKPLDIVRIVMMLMLKIQFVATNIHLKPIKIKLLKLKLFN